MLQQMMNAFALTLPRIPMPYCRRSLMLAMLLLVFCWRVVVFATGDLSWWGAYLDILQSDYSLQ